MKPISFRRAGWAVLAVLVLPAVLAAQAHTISLAGAWNIALDPEETGHTAQWWLKPIGTDEIFLPGTTDLGGYGTKTKGPEAGWLSRPHLYQGAVWYRKDVVVPEAWHGQRITLFLERAHWQTEVWVDDAAFGSENSLSTPHVYDLTKALTPGRHRITICVDNSLMVDVGVRASSVTDYTQTNWNGIVGRIELQARPLVWIDSAQVHAAAKGMMRIVAQVRSAAGGEVAGELSARGRSVSFARAGEVELTVPAARSEGWLDDTELRLTARAGGQSFADRLRIDFATRRLTTRGTQFILNDKPIFLRGTLECANFPLTGHPPMDAEPWDRIFRIAKEYGLNHFRFHSWCPPEAAFAAADRAGFVLQIELPVWSNRVGKDPALNEFMRAEGHRILRTYGNHPSFAMLCLGNELNGDFAFMDGLVAEFKQADPRHLYTFTDDIARRAVGPTSDYHVTNMIEGARLRIWGSRFAKQNSGTDVDFSATAAAVPVPLVAHELGQWAVYPNYEEIGEYTGLLKPRNLEAFRNQLAARGMLDQAKDFQDASGKFAWALYKEDIETAMRTPKFGGVQLLQLQDFSGQGEALIGLLDAFWQSKGILTAQEFRRFFSDTVPLLRFPKRVWSNDETFTATAQAAGRWSAVDDGGNVLASGRGKEVRLPLTGIASARRVRVSLQAGGGENDWDIWVYPKQLTARGPAEVLVTAAFDEAAKRKLADGGKVALLWPPSQPNGHMQPMSFLPVFWSLTWFPKQPGTMGILCDPRHPALASFPTANHSDWQWWEVTEGARVFILDDLAPAFRPLVQAIDDFHRNHKLGAVFEARVGRGKLLVSSFDLESRLLERVVARQLRHSLLEYAASPKFEPTASLTVAELENLLRVEPARKTELEGPQHREAAPWPKKR